MRLILLLSLFLTVGTVHAMSMEQIKSLKIVQDCTILNMSGEVVKVFPGKMCIFFDDGSLISANEKEMKFYNKKNEIAWRLPGHFHHQLAMSNDRKKILALSSEAIIEKGVRIRQDKLLIISLEGKILEQQKSEVLLEITKQKWLRWTNSPWLSEETKTATEISHFNSFYEIPKNASANNKDSPFKEGNYIVNGLSNGLYVLSPDLKKVLFHKIMSTSMDHFIHDVQVNAKGNIIYFNNFTAAPGATEGNGFSTIHEYDIVNQKVVFEFRAIPETMFFSRYCGSIQELDDDHILFADKFNGTWIYSRAEKKLVLTLRGTHFQNKLPVFNQTTKAYNLTIFFQNK